MFPKFICFPLPNVGKFDVYAIRRCLLKTAISKRSKEKRKLVYDMEKIEKKIKQALSNIEFLSSVRCYAEILIVKFKKLLRPTKGNSKLLLGTVYCQLTLKILLQTLLHMS